MKIIERLKRNPCKECMYYVSTNNVCQSKKCASNNPYVTIFDRLLCEPRICNHDKHISADESEGK